MLVIMNGIVDAIIELISGLFMILLMGWLFYITCIMLKLIIVELMDKKKNNRR